MRTGGPWALFLVVQRQLFADTSKRMIKEIPVLPETFTRMWLGKPHYWSLQTRSPHIVRRIISERWFFLSHVCTPFLCMCNCVAFCVSGGVLKYLKTKIKITMENFDNRIDHMRDRQIEFEFTSWFYIKENKSRYMVGTYELYLTIWKEQAHTR